MSLEQLQSEFPCEVQPLSPFGLVLGVPPKEQVSLRSLPTEPIKSLLLEHRLILLRGFPPMPDKDAFSQVARMWGELLEWDFGTVFEVAEHADPKNYLFTNGSVPYHWDGAFAKEVPWLQFFQCLEAPIDGGGGETIFCDTTAVWDSLDDETRRCWQSIEVDYSTEQVAHYGGVIREKLVARHPQTQETVIRFAEPDNATTVPLNTPKLEIRGIPNSEVPAFLKELTHRLYDPRFVYAHRWSPADFLLADNHVLLHGRTPYQENLSRRLWRIHVL